MTGLTELNSRPVRRGGGHRRTGLLEITGRLCQRRSKLRRQPPCCDERQRQAEQLSLVRSNQRDTDVLVAGLKLRDQVAFVAGCVRNFALPPTVASPESRDRPSRRLTRL